MGPVPGREALEAMKRVDIQKLCKVRPSVLVSFAQHRRHATLAGLWRKGESQDRSTHRSPP